MDPARILIVDDQPAFAKGLRALLLAEGQDGSQEIEVAYNAEEALDAAEFLSPHLILMDIRLPGKSGIEATLEIKALFPSTLVVMLTASDDEKDLLDALKAGASGYLLKTMELEEIATAVEAIIHGNLVIPAHLAGAIKASFEENTGGFATMLTQSEADILRYLASGESNDKIARKMKVSTEEVSKRVSGIYTKLHITTRAEAAAAAARLGLKE
ncbi:MAG: response regulator transcription factor [Actinomycetota bacterium]